MSIRLFLCPLLAQSSDNPPATQAQVMIRQLVHSAGADLIRPLSSWSKVSLIGSAASILFLGLRGGIPYPKHFDSRDFAAESVLVISVCLGVFALTRKSKGKILQVVILLVDFSLGWFYLVFGFFQVPWVLVSNAIAVLSRWHLWH
jgi:hypothetical protein